MKTTFRNDEYVRSHGKNPQGFGMWAFRVVLLGNSGEYSDLEGCQPLFYTGTLTQAKKQVKERAMLEAKQVGRCREILVDVLG